MVRPFRTDSASAGMPGLFHSLIHPAADKSALALLLAVEFWLFSGSFEKFFTHDSLFYLIHAPQSWAQLWQYFLAPGEEKNYRPLNMALMALLRPLLGLDTYAYHWIPLLFHLANTVLFYSLVKRIMNATPAVLAATAFWGLHSVAGWITYDITYLSDFLLAFLLLVSLLSAVEAFHRRSLLWTTASLLIFLFSLFTKEAAITFPLAVWITLSLADLRASGRAADWKAMVRSYQKTFARTCLYALPAAAFTALFIYWQQSGLLYTQNSGAAYSIDPWANPLAKWKYLYWALNLPDVLRVDNPERNRALVLVVMGMLFFIWSLDLLRRRFRLSAVEWSGLAWFLGLNIPSLLLSNRLGKWYLYIPLFGLAMLFGVLAENLTLQIPRHFLRPAGPILTGLLSIPIFFSSLLQTRSYIASSDCSYQSEVLQVCLKDFRKAHPTLPAQINLFFLPAFDDGISTLLSVPPIDRGQLFQLFYPASRVRAFFAHKGDRFPDQIRGRSDWIILQYLDGHLYDVTGYFQDSSRMTLFLLPTSEGIVAPLLQKEPAGGRKLYQERVQLLLGDEGAILPEDYLRRRDIWILQYLDGHFEDVTSYYVNDRRKTMLLLPTMDGRVPALRSLKESSSTADRLLQSRVRFLSSDDLAHLPQDYLRQPEVSFFLDLGGYFYDVTTYIKPGGRMSLFLLPTFEGKVPLPVRRDPHCRNRVCSSPIDTRFGDEGAQLPEDYFRRDDLWIVQYMAGSFSDVTGYYKGRRRDSAKRIIQGLENLSFQVDRAEYYPNYDHFGTPTGAPVFFSTPQKEILTQIGGSSLVVPLRKIPADSLLRFDISWMYSQGDGAWAEASLRSVRGQSVVYRAYMRPEPDRKSLFWKEVRIHLGAFAEEEADLILKCYNDPGRNTVADWLNWRDIAIESR